MSQARVTRALVYFAKFKTLVDNKTCSSWITWCYYRHKSSPMGVRQPRQKKNWEEKGLLGRFCVVNAGNFGCDMWRIKSTPQLESLDSNTDLILTINILLWVIFRHWRVSRSSHEQRDTTSADALEQRKIGEWRNYIEELNGIFDEFHLVMAKLS